jgi:hypothetical protein
LTTQRTAFGSTPLSGAICANALIESAVASMLLSSL